MNILIVKEEASKIPRECSLEEAHAIAARGFVVLEDKGSGETGPLPPLEDEPSIETKVYEDGTTATGPAPLPAKSPAAKKTRSKKA